MQRGPSLGFQAVDQGRRVGGHEVTVDPIADFRAGFDGSNWDPNWLDFYCDWRDRWFNQRIKPPSWVAGDDVIAAGAKGILFRFRYHEGGTNLLIYPDTLGATDVLAVFDPGASLPKTRIRAAEEGETSGQLDFKCQ